jgi:hypothetical protein
VTQSELPPGATPINPAELLVALGELYLQVRTLRILLAQQQQAASPAVVELENTNHAVSP